MTKLQNGLTVGDFAIYSRYGNYELVKIEELVSLEDSESETRYGNVQISWPEKPHKNYELVYGLSLITLDQLEIELEKKVQDFWVLQETIENHTGMVINCV